MNEALKNLLLKLSSDEKLFLQLIGKNSIDEMYEFCLTIQKGDYSRKDIELILIRLLRELTDQKKLSDEELKDVNGGLSMSEFLNQIYNPISPFNAGRQLGQLWKNIINDSENDASEEALLETDMETKLQ